MKRAGLALFLMALACLGSPAQERLAAAPAAASDERALRDDLARVRRARGEGDPKVAEAVIALARDLEAQGRSRAVEDLFRFEIDASRKNADKANTRVLSQAFAEWLLRVRRPADAELIARSALELGRLGLGAGDWRLDDTKSLIGEALGAQRKFAPAEALLLDAQKSLAAAAEAPAGVKRKTIQRLVDLYEAWERASPGQGKMAEASRWRERL